MTAIEERIDALLAVGCAREVVAELDQLVAAEPLRERFWAQLMLALYRTGRQADALAAYQRARRHLTEELGLEPSPELGMLQQAILRHDRALIPPPTAPPPAHGGGRRRRRRRGMAAALAAAMLAVVALAAAVLVRPGASPNGVSSLPPRSLAAIDAASGAVDGHLPLGAEADAVTADSNRVWVAEGAERAVVQIDPARMRVMRTFRLQSFPVGIAAGAGRAWAGNGFAGTVTQFAVGGGVSPPLRPTPTSTGRLALAYGAGSLWIGSQDNALARVDPATGRTTARVPHVIAPAAIAVDPRAVWVAQATRAALLRVDTRSNRVVRSIPLGGSATALAADSKAVWALTPAAGRLWRIDPLTNAVTAVIEVGPNVTHIAIAGPSVWTAAASTGVLQRISPRTDTVVQTVRLGRALGGMAADDQRIWITVR